METRTEIYDQFSVQTGVYLRRFSSDGTVYNWSDIHVPQNMVRRERERDREREREQIDTDTHKLPTYVFIYLLTFEMK
jgi:hypothetical protein